MAAGRAVMRCQATGPRGTPTLGGRVVTPPHNQRLGRGVYLPNGARHHAHTLGAYSHAPTTPSTNRRPRTIKDGGGAGRVRLPSNRTAWHAHTCHAPVEHAHQVGPPRGLPGWSYGRGKFAQNTWSIYNNWSRIASWTDFGLLYLGPPGAHEREVGLITQNTSRAVGWRHPRPTHPPGAEIIQPEIG